MNTADRARLRPGVVLGHGRWRWYVLEVKPSRVFADTCWITLAFGLAARGKLHVLDIVETTAEALAGCETCLPVDGYSSISADYALYMAVTSLGADTLQRYYQQLGAGGTARAVLTLADQLRRPEPTRLIPNAKRGTVDRVLELTADRRLAALRDISRGMRRGARQPAKPAQAVPA